MVINSSESENSSESFYNLYNSVILRVNSILLQQQPYDSLGNVTPLLSDSQIYTLAATEYDSGILCLLKMWFGLEDEFHCNTVWDHIYCWPPTLAGTTIKKSCSEVLQNTHPLSAPNIQGYAYRQCLDNGTWSRGIKTNYSECAKALRSSANQNDEHLTSFVHYMVFIGSILSLLCLGIALAMLCSFRNVWNERIKVHVHLMLSLVLRFVVFLIISEPFVLKRSSSYRDNNTLCKTVLIAHLYATVSSTSWMLVQGIYLNGRLTTNVFGFGSRRAFKKFYFLGWVVPLILLGIYVAAMIASHNSENCWEGYAGMDEIWILLVPMKAEMLLNGLYLCNILRIVLKKRRDTNGDSEFAQIKSVAKVTLLLFPILGLNNLLFLYNPGGEYETIYVSLNISLGSTQGIPVAIVYCFNCTEVHKAIRRSYYRYVARRSVVNVSVCNTAEVAMVTVRAPECNQQYEDEDETSNNDEGYV